MFKYIVQNFKDFMKINSKKFKKWNKSKTILHQGYYS